MSPRDLLAGFIFQHVLHSGYHDRVCREAHHSGRPLGNLTLGDLRLQLGPLLQQ